MNPPDPGPRSASHANGILCLIVALMTVGIVMTFSTTSRLVPPGHPMPWWQSLVVRQIAFSLLALIVLLAASRCDYHVWLGRSRGYRQPLPWLAAGAVLLLIAVMIPHVGVERNGARRWLAIGPGSAALTFQPSEMCKVALILCLAAYCAWRADGLRRFFHGLLPALLGIGAAAAMVGVEDFGTAALLVGVGGAILWASRARKTHLLLCSLPAIAALTSLVVFWPYRLRRITGFLDIWKDPQGDGYHAIQSLIGIANGGLWGQGLGNGVQAHGYLPEARSDFVFAILCEELGIVGGAAVIGLFMALLWQGGRAMRRAPDEFGRALALGATATIAVQAAINIGVVTVSLPTKGIALPFISAGGTSAVFLAFLGGLLANVARSANIPSPSPMVPAADDRAELFDLYQALPTTT